MKVNAIAALAALALSSSLALAQSDQNTSINGPAATQRGVENMQNGGRNLGDPSTMKNDGDYMQACKPLSAEARKDCMAQAKRDGMSSEPGQSRTTDRDAMGKQSDKR